MADVYVNVMQDMLDMQRSLQIKSYGQDPLELGNEELMDWIRWNVLACEDELHEAMAESGWKPWATSNHINKEAFFHEMIDAWHFFMNLLLVTGYSANDFYRAYIDKHHLNAKRQADGYDGIAGKCKVCGRALDDPHVKCTEDRCEFVYGAKA